jgi:hypothetical protein
MRRRKPTRKRSAEKKPASRKTASRRKKPIHREKQTRFIERSENTSAQIHQGVVSEETPSEPARSFPENDAEYGEES